MNSANSKEFFSIYKIYCFAFFYADVKCCLISNRCHISALMNATRISCMRAPQSQLLVAAKQSINVNRFVELFSININLLFFLYFFRPLAPSQSHRSVKLLQAEIIQVFGLLKKRCHLDSLE